MFQLMHGKFCLNGHVTTGVVSYVGDGNKHNLGIYMQLFFLVLMSWFIH